MGLSSVLYHAYILYIPYSRHFKPLKVATALRAKILPKTDQRCTLHIIKKDKIHEYSAKFRSKSTFLTFNRTRISCLEREQKTVQISWHCLLTFLSSLENSCIWIWSSVYESQNTGAFYYFFLLGWRRSELQWFQLKFCLLTDGCDCI